MATIRKVLSRPEIQHHQSLVIGATGWVGSHIVVELVERRMAVRCLRRWNSETSRLSGLDVEQVVGDARDYSSLVDAMSGCNYVFYAAAPSIKLGASAMLKEGVEAIRTVIDAAREVGVDRLVVTSSAVTLAGEGTAGRLVSEDDVYLPGTSGDLFVEAKYAVEQECARYSADGADIVLLNPGLCVGPGVDLRPYLRLGVADSERVNFVDVRDVACAHVDALTNAKPGARYALGGVNGTVGDLLADWRSERLASQWLKRQSRRVANRVLHGPVVRDAELVRCGRWIDSSQAQSDLGWSSRL